MPILGPILSSAGRKPGTPTIGTATAGSAQATVTFTEPTYLGKPNSPLTYTAISSPSSISNTGSASPIIVTGLSNGTSYSFTVKLNNTVLDSEFSGASNSVTPAGVTTTTTTAAPTAAPTSPPPPPTEPPGGGGPPPTTEVTAAPGPNPNPNCNAYITFVYPGSPGYISGCNNYASIYNACNQFIGCND